MGFFIEVVVLVLATVAFVMSRRAKQTTDDLEQRVEFLSRSTDDLNRTIQRLRSEVADLRGSAGGSGAGEMALAPERAAAPTGDVPVPAEPSASPPPYSVHTPGYAPPDRVETPAAAPPDPADTPASAPPERAAATVAATPVPATSPKPARLSTAGSYPRAESRTPSGSHPRAGSLPPAGPRPPADPRRPAGSLPPDDRPSLEERLGARLPVWIGAIAIALAGAFLVKYSFDQGWVGPGVRVSLGALLGVVALGVGEWLRPRSASIAAGLSAAGIAVLYASVLASGELYGFIGPVTTFGLMALVTATAVALSLRQGPIIAAIGLIGGFATPLLIETSDPSALRLFAYLALVALGLLVVSDRRGWWEIGGASLGASIVWVLLWLTRAQRPEDGVILLAFLLVVGAAFLVASARRPVGDSAPPLWVPFAGAIAVLIASGVVLDAGGYRGLDWALIGLIGAGTIVAGRLRPDWEAMPWLAAGLGLVLLYVWSADAPAAAGTLAAPYASRTIVTAALGALFAIGGYTALWGARRPSMWAGLSGASMAAYFLFAYLDRSSDGPAGLWGGMALALAAAATAAAVPIARRREEMEDGATTLGVFAAAITSLIALAIPIELSQEWISVAWGLQAAAVVWIAHRLDVPLLRRLAWPLAALVGVRLLLNPYIADYPIGQIRIINWLLYGYGLPIVAFVAASIRADLDGDARLAGALRGLAIALGFWLIGLQIHHIYVLDDLSRPIRSFAEASTYSWAWLAYALGLWLAARKWPSEELERGGLVIAAIAILVFFAGPLTGFNPLFARQTLSEAAGVGEWPILNWLIPAYGFPAVLALSLAYEAGRRPSRLRFRPHLAAVAMVAVFALLSLEIRHLFQGPELIIAGSTTTFAERSTYPWAWLAYALGLWLAARKWPREELEMGGLVIAGIAILAFLTGPLTGFNPLFGRGTLSEAAGVGEWPILNWLIPAYGFPAVLALGLAYESGRHPSRLRFRPYFAAVAMVAVFALLSLEIRHLFQGPELMGAGSSATFAERSTYPWAWLAYALVLWRAARRWPREELEMGGLVIAGIAILALLTGPLTGFNPLFARGNLSEAAWVGEWPILNWLVPAYGFPAVLAVGLAAEAGRHSSRHQVRALFAAVAMLAGFALLSLEIRQLFQGPVLMIAGSTTTFAERSTYSIAWILFSAGLLAIGINRGWRSARYGSLVVMFVAVTKVFLVDVGTLGGLYRVGSFLGLGASLLGIAWLYQHFVVGRGTE